jgi:hypothetical protein
MWGEMQYSFSQTSVRLVMEQLFVCGNVADAHGSVDIEARNQHACRMERDLGDAPAVADLDRATLSHSPNVEQPDLVAIG